MGTTRQWGEPGLDVLDTAHSSQATIGSDRVGDLARHDARQTRMRELRTDLDGLVCMPLSA